MQIDHERAAKAIIELCEAIHEGYVEVIAALEENMVITTGDSDAIEDFIERIEDTKQGFPVDD